MHSTVRINTIFLSLMSNLSYPNKRMWLSKLHYLQDDVGTGGRGLVVVGARV